MKLFLPHSLHKYCAAVQATSRKQHFNTPTLNGGEGEWVWIVLFSEVNPFKDSVSTILSPIVAAGVK